MGRKTQQQAPGACMRGQPRKGCSGSLLTGCLPVPVQLVFAEQRDLKVDLFTLSPPPFFFFNEWT